MESNDFFQLGHVQKSHGLIGEVVIQLDVKDPSYYNNLDLLFLDQNTQLIPFLIESLSIHGDKMRVKLEEINHRDSANGLIGQSVFLPVKYLPKLKLGEYYFHDLIDFDIRHQKNIIGKVEQIYDLGTQTLISTTIEGKEVMIPTNKDILVEVSLKKRLIVVELPDGLLDLYQES